MDLKFILENKNTLIELEKKVNDLNVKIDKGMNFRSKFLGTVEFLGFSYFLISFVQTLPNNFFKNFLACLIPISFFITLLFSFFEQKLSFQIHNKIFSLFFKQEKEPNLILEQYQETYIYVSKSDSKKINKLFNSLNDIELKFLEAGFKTDGSFNNIDDFFYKYLVNYISNTNKDLLKDNKNLILECIDSLYCEDLQKQVLNRYINKLKGTKYNSPLITQASDVIDNLDNETLDIFEVNKKQLVKQI